MKRFPSIQVALATGLGASLLGLTKLVCFPMLAPTPDPLPARLTQQLQSAGWRLERSSPARGGRDLSQGQGVELSLPTTGARLTLIPVRVRNHKQFTIEAISEALGQPLESGRRRIQLSNDELLLGRNSAHSCVTKAGGRVDPRGLELGATSAMGAWDGVQLALGQRQFKTWRCTAVRLSLPAEADAGSRTERIWREIGPILRQAQR